MKKFALVLIVLGTGGLAYESALITASLLKANRIEEVPVAALTVLDTNKVWVKDHFEATVRLKNNTRDPLKVVEMLNSCSCASSEIVESDAMPDRAGVVKLKLKVDAALEHRVMILYENASGEKYMMSTVIDFDK